MIYHLTERHPGVLNPRQIRASASWEALYSTGRMIPAHFWVNRPGVRLADKTIGDPRPLPYLKDELWHGVTVAKNPDDIIAWTNDDTILHPGILDKIEEMAKHTVFSSHRVEIMLPNPEGYSQLTPESLSKFRVEHQGRDAFFFTRRWLVTNFMSIPDFIHGASEWDLCLATAIRIEHKLPTALSTLDKQYYPCDMPLGYVIHEYHESSWRDGWHRHPSEKHNVELARNWLLARLGKDGVWEHLDYT